MVKLAGGHLGRLAAVALALCLAVVSGAALAAGPKLPFGSHREVYAAGMLRPSGGQTAADRATAAAYDLWKSRYLERGCGAGEYRVAADTGEAWVVSEGQGYGMLIAVMMAGHDPDAQAIFDGLHRYNRRHPSQNDRRLVAWAQDADCNDILNADSATDGDLDIAYALLLAHRQWGSEGAIDYAAAARTVMAALWRRNVNRSTRLVNLGDWVTPSSKRYAGGTRSSDWMLGHFRAFTETAGGARWASVLEAHQDAIATMQADSAPKTGLLPDFMVAEDGSIEPAPPFYLEAKSDGSYSWNACRTPWRIGIDAAMSGDPRSIAAVRRMSRWMRSTAKGDPARIRDGYTLAGRVIEGGNDLAFLAPFAVAAMADPGAQRWLDALWREMTRRGPEGYYGDSIRLLAMLAVSRNWLTP